ncbi:Kelch repeat-containing protein [Rubrivirga sp.]|uniref:Kelch repeat-containing protein n=1 Tax=Rubrivirga sp. TaxID=1885344 RepID=UPI003B51F357
MRTPFAPLLALLLAWSLAPPAVAQEWESIDGIRTPRAGAAGAVLDGRLFVIGGRDAEGRPLTSVEVFEPGVGWTVTTNLSVARVNAAASVLDGRVVVMGGADANGEPIADAEAYEPDLGSWVPFEPLQTPREGLGAATVDSTLYAIGGAGPQGMLLESVEAYTDGWAPLVAWRLVPARAQFGAVEQDGAVIIVGGISTVGPVPDVERFDPATGVTTPLADLLSARGGVAVAAHDGRIFAVGGRNAGDDVLASVSALTLGPGAEWEVQAPLPRQVEGAVAGVLGEHLYVAGGGDQFGGVVSSVYRLPLRPVDTAAERPPLGGLGLSVVGPNPSRSGTALEVRADGRVRLSVVDLLGREVAVLHDGPVRGAARVTWDGRVPAGVYVARVVGPGVSVSVPLTVVR